MRLSEAAESLLTATKSEGRSPRTVGSYRENLSHLVRFLGDPGLPGDRVGIQLAGYVVGADGACVVVSLLRIPVILRTYSGNQ
jgi:hypothetical protein